MMEEPKMNERFYRLTETGNAAILDAETGAAITRLDADVYPLGSLLSARYEHPDGIVLTVADARSIGVAPEYCTQNNGDCSTCSLVNYGRDCRNNPIGH